MAAKSRVMVANIKPKVATIKAIVARRKLMKIAVLSGRREKNKTSEVTFI
jgi:hypothetical protein